jgi:hypothetical protein
MGPALAHSEPLLLTTDPDEQCYPGRASGRDFIWLQGVPGSDK